MSQLLHHANLRVDLKCVKTMFLFEGFNAYLNAYPSKHQIRKIVCFAQLYHMIKQSPSMKYMMVIPVTSPS